MKKKPKAYYCGAKRTKRKGRCRLRAGAGTLHKGRGKCSWHGGISRADDGRLKRGGRYSQVLPDLLRDRYEEFLTSEEAIEDVSSEIALKRTVLITFLSPALKRLTEEALAGDIDLGDVAALLGWAGEIEKGAMRFARIANMGALTQGEVSLIELAVVDLFVRYIPDEDKRLQAVSELAWRLGRVRSEQEQRALSEEGDDG